MEILASWQLLSGWSVVLALMAGLYLLGAIRLHRRAGRGVFTVRRVVAAVVSLVALTLALIGPFEVFSGEALWAHMIQHVLFVGVAAPAMLIAAPLPVFMWALPQTLRLGVGEQLSAGGPVRRVMTALTRPKLALPLFILMLWAWHYPPAYELAISNTYVHFAEHLSMVLFAMLFWWPVIGPPPIRSPLPYPLRLLYLVLVLTPTAALAALITIFAATLDTVLYQSYVTTPRHLGLSAKDDQIIAGLILWIPGNMIYLTAVTVLFFKWAAKEMPRYPDE